MPKEHENHFLLYLVEKVFSGRVGKSALAGWPENIPHEFFSYKPTR